MVRRIEGIGKGHGWWLSGRASPVNDGTEALEGLKDVICHGEPGEMFLGVEVRATSEPGSGGAATVGPT